MKTLLIGDFLLRPKALGFTHVGVWLGGGAVFHNAPLQGEHVSSVTDFAQGAPVMAQRSNADPAAVVARVRAKLAAPNAYDAVINNCEHSANSIVTGKASSAQLRVALGLLALAIAAVVIARKR